jgi:hypothetical protein
MRYRALLFLLLPALLGQAPAAADLKADPAAKARREHFREIYLGDAASYAIYLDATRKEKAELRREPAYSWTNPIREAQDGDVFVWTYRGRPEAVGTIFSSPAPVSGRYIIHELHSLSLSVLEVDRPGHQGWKPLQPGIELRPIPGSPVPAGSAPQRLSQMRALIREFSASAVDYQDRRWELRVLPQPLYRYESTDPNVLDGAVFTLVSNAGTDPELMMVLETRKAGGDPSSPATWQFGAARFSDMALSVKLRDKVIYTAPLIPFGSPVPDPTHRYHLINDRTIPPVEESDKASDPGRTP